LSASTEGSVPEKLVIGVWQGVCVSADMDANLKRAGEVIDEAGDTGCDIVCLPETFLSGYNKESVDKGKMPLTDKRLIGLAEKAGKRNLVAIVGMSEDRGDKVANTMAVLEDGKVIGHYSKTMLTGGDSGEMGFCIDDDLPVFHAKGVCFGVIVCHDSTFPEVASTLAWKGARIIFSPHYNGIGAPWMDDHRIQVRNNHVGIAAHFGVIVARSNVIGIPSGDRKALGYGDSSIFGPNGYCIAEAGLFTEKLITADVAPLLGKHRWRTREQLRMSVIQQNYDAAKEALAAAEKRNEKEK